MGKTDRATKRFLSDRRVFADLVNYSVYGGRQVVRAEDVRETDTEQVLDAGAPGRAPDLRRLQRDLAMEVVVRTCGDVKYVVVGVENQSRADLTMPMRCMLYDAMRHLAHARRRKAENGENCVPGRDFLTGLSPEDRFPPVVTLVVYWGEGRWTAPRSLHEMLDFPDERLKGLCADYRLNLVEPMAMSDEEFRILRTDLGAVLHYVKVQDDPDAIHRLLREDGRFRALDRDAAEVLRAVTGTAIPIINQKEEKIDMCKGEEQLKQRAFEEGKQTGFQEGKQTGFQEGKQTGFQEGILGTVSVLREFQLSVEQIQEKLMKTYAITADEAMKYIAG